VSNSAIAAVWTALEGIIFGQANYGGLDVHGGPTGNFYSPFTLTGPTWGASPIFAGMVLEKELDGASVLPTVSPGAGSIVWSVAFRSAAGKYEFLIANTDLANSWPVQVSASGVSGSNQATLIAQGAYGLPYDLAETLGGAQIGPNGAWAGVASVSPRGSTILLPAASAALVTLQ
jgi:hypothetical protein